MDKDITFSIIVPIYNVEKYLLRCLESIQNQTYRNFEVLLIDDGSPDNSKKICKKFEEQDNRFKYFYKENGGLSDARNYGIKEAKKDYLIFLDSDDYIKEDYLEKFYKKLKEKDFEIVFSGYIDSYQNNKNFVHPLKEYFYENEIIDKYSVIYGRMLGKLPNESKGIGFKSSVWANCYKKDFILDNKLKFESERIYVSEDMVFHTQICKYNPSIAILEEYCGYFYCHNSNSLTTTFKSDRLEKEINLNNYLLENVNDVCLEMTECKIQLHKRISRTFIERVDNVIGNFIMNKKEINYNSLFENQNMIYALDLLRKDKKNLTLEVRCYLYRKKRKMMLKLLHKIAKK